jgi:hypothetical protein
MWVGGAGIMFALVMAVFFAWSRVVRTDGGLGWLESARRANFAAVVGGQQGADPAAPRQVNQASGTKNVDDDEHLAAYNDYLARLNKSHER